MGRPGVSPPSLPHRERFNLWPFNSIIQSMTKVSSLLWKSKIFNKFIIYIFIRRDSYKTINKIITFENLCIFKTRSY